ncbi:murein hydrolase transporter LrgA [Mannheimia granulomatis]|uniref:CidA/LrgA family protein n=1 Tax=Mannheimia granulomatis TaxID=85402 RepID=UPI00159EB911|nr:CidA/LrgA family protein [Mannheimia granulomatis]QLB14828.1 murein hydrolase transporter LrgA [Mannheimia granulomatis]
MLLKIVRVLLSLVLLFMFLYLGKLMVYFFPIGIPDSILGMLLLLIGLVSGIIKVEWVIPGGRLLIRYMTLFFLPICVELVEHFDLLAQNLNSLVLSNILSTSLSLVLIGVFAQWIFHRKINKRG